MEASICVCYDDHRVFVMVLNEVIGQKHNPQTYKTVAKHDCAHSSNLIDPLQTFWTSWRLKSKQWSVGCITALKYGGMDAWVCISNWLQWRHLAAVTDILHETDKWWCSILMELWWSQAASHAVNPGLIKIAIFLIKIKKIDFFDLNRIFLI